MLSDMKGETQSELEAYGRETESKPRVKDRGLKDRRS